MQLVFACVLILILIPASATEQITWLLPDFAPASIPENGKPGNGISDELLKLIIARWPEVEHQFLRANPKRTWAMIESGEKVCQAASLRTPDRERLAYFSNSHLLPPVQVVARKDALNTLPHNAAGEILLPELLASPKLRGALAEKRSFGPSLDLVIEKRPAESTLRLAAPADFGGKILQMMALGRLDYTLEYDFVLAYQQEMEPQLEELRSFPIAGNNEFLIAGVACPRTDWGRAAISKIDTIITANAKSPQIRGALERWLTPEAKRRYDSALSNFYKQRAKPSDPNNYR